MGGEWSFTRCGATFPSAGSRDKSVGSSWRPHGFLCERRGEERADGGVSKARDCPNGSAPRATFSLIHASSAGLHFSPIAGCCVQINGQVMSNRSEPGLMLSVTAYAPGSRLAPHTHDAPFLCLALTGQFEEVSPNGTLSVGPLTSLLRRPGTHHANHFGPTQARCLNVAIDPRWLAEAGGTHLSSAGISHRSHEADLAGLRVYAAHCRNTGSETMESLVVEWLAAFDSATPVGPDRALLSAHEAIMSSDKPLRVRDLAAIAQCHPITFARRFRQQWGVGPAEFGRRVRLRRACAAVVDSAEPLSRVASKFGYVDQAHLHRAVQSETGLPLGSLRRASRAP